MSKRRFLKENQEVTDGINLPTLETLLFSVMYTDGTFPLYAARVECCVALVRKYCSDLRSSVGFGVLVSSNGFCVLCSLCLVYPSRHHDLRSFSVAGEIKIERRWRRREKSQGG